MGVGWVDTEVEAKVEAKAKTEVLESGVKSKGQKAKSKEQ